MKNIIYLFADQWRRQALGFMGQDGVLTPNIDKFSEEAVVFNNAVSCYPVCSPHRASLLTGLYPMNHGVVTNCKTGLDIHLKPGFKTFGSQLKDAGYSTGYIGKWHLDEPELNKNENPESGASGWDAYTPPGPKRHGFDYWYSYGAADNHRNPHYWMESPQKIIVDKWSVEHETDMAIEFIKKRENEPFALFVSWNPPHTPFDMVPDRYKKIYEKRDIEFRENVNQAGLKSIFSSSYNTGFYNEEDENLENYTRDYFAAVTGVDENFGRIIDYLKERGLYNNTIVVLSSDHGELLGSHGLMNKLSWHEESIGIPLIIKNTGEKRGLSCDTVINTVDQMPTILSLAGVDIPEGVDGTDLSGIFSGDKEEFITKDAFITGCDGRGEKIEYYKKRGVDLRSSGWRALRTGTHTYLLTKHKKEIRRYLYDLRMDPYQKSPREIKNPFENRLTADLEKRLQNYIKSCNDPFLRYK